MSNHTNFRAMACAFCDRVRLLLRAVGSLLVTQVPSWHRNNLLGLICCKSRPKLQQVRPVDKEREEKAGPSAGSPGPGDTPDQDEDMEARYGFGISFAGPELLFPNESVVTRYD